MHLSTRARYAIMALIDLAYLQKENEGQTPITLAEIAERQDISLSYLEQLFAKLRRHDIVKSMRGPGGGYTLAKDPKDTPLSEIILAVNEPMKMTRCGAEDGNKDGCMADKARCNAHHLWMALSDHIQDFVNSTTLEMVINDELKKNNNHKAA